MTASPSGCGVLEHAESCLCDVVITKPLPPLEACMTDAIRSMWMADVMCEVRGYCQPWTNEKILDFLVDMERFYDAWHETNHHVGTATQLSQVAPLQIETGMNKLQEWLEIRTTIATCMNKFLDATITDIVCQLQLQPQDVVDAMTTARSGALPWDYERLQLLDDILNEEHISWTEAGRRLQMTDDAVRNISKYWETRRKHKWGSVRPEPAHRTMLWTLALETDLMPSEIIRRVYEKYNHQYSRSAVTNIRRRHKRNKTGTI